MCSKILWIVALSFLAFGCSSAKKSEPAAAASPAVSAPSAPGNQAPSTVSTDVEESTTTCVSGAEKRMMEIEKSNPGCKLKYSRFSASDPVAWSFKGPGYCAKVRNQIRDTLEAAGFKCK